MLKKSINVNIDGTDYTITHETTAWAGRNLVTINGELLEDLPKGMKHIIFDIELNGKQAKLITNRNPMDVVIDGVSQTTKEQIDVAKAQKIPWWVWIFVAFSTALFAYGVVGVALGVASVFFCINFGRNIKRSTAIRVLACTGVTVAAWLILILIAYAISTM